MAIVRCQHSVFSMQPANARCEHLVDFYSLCVHRAIYVQPTGQKRKPIRHRIFCPCLSPGIQLNLTEALA